MKRLTQIRKRDSRRGDPVAIAEMGIRCYDEGDFDGGT